MSEGPGLVSSCAAINLPSMSFEEQHVSQSSLMEEVFKVLVKLKGLGSRIICNSINGAAWEFDSPLVFPYSKSHTAAEAQVSVNGSSPMGDLSTLPGQHLC